MLRRKSPCKAQWVFAFSLAMLMYSTSAGARTLVVDDSPGGGEFTTIQAAINAAVGRLTDPPAARDTIVVRDGTYKGIGNREIDFRGKAITLISENGPNTTIIDCEGAGRAFRLSSGETNQSKLSGFTVTNAYGESGGAFLLSAGAALTIENCNIQNNRGVVGGALYATSPNSLILRNCTIARNKTSGEAGALHIKGGSVTLVDCSITGNSSSSRDGGALRIYSAKAVLRNCRVDENRGNSGGGLCGVFSNITIEKSSFNKNVSTWAGGAIQLYGSTSTITDSEIKGNSSAQGGGGIYCDTRGASLNLSGTLIKGNTSATQGGGVYLASEGGVNIRKCTISENSAGRTYTGSGSAGNMSGGGGIYCFFAPTVSVSDCSILNNRAVVGWASDGGGGIHILKSYLTLSNCLIAGNRAVLSSPTSASYARGGAMHVSSGSPTLINCTVVGNTSQNAGGCISGLLSSASVFTNSIFWGNSPRELENSQNILRYCNVKGGWKGAGDHNISVDPLFVNPQTGDYHLQPSSPSIDAGTNGGAPSSDMEGVPRQDGNGDGVITADMGAFEYLNRNTPPIANAGENRSLSSDETISAVILGHASDEDADDLLQYRWVEKDLVLLEWAPVETSGQCPLDLKTILLPIGAHSLTLEVSDGESKASDVMELTVENSAPHVAVRSGSGTYQINTDVVLQGEVSDYDGDALTYQWVEITNGTDGIQTAQEVPFCSGSIPTAPGGKPTLIPTPCIQGDLSLGTHRMALQVSDGINETVSSDAIEVQIVDTTAPTLAPVANTGILWPPNHKMVTVVIRANAMDNSGLPVSLSASVTSNEPVDGLGDGDTAPDWSNPVINQANGTLTLKLRAERSGTGSGREYTVKVVAMDISGNSSSADIKLIVPHDRSAK